MDQTERAIRRLMLATEKIDGVVALIMALDRAQRNLNGGSVYDERGLLTLDW